MASQEPSAEQRNVGRELRVVSERWPQFFDEFSSEHAQARISVEVLTPDVGPHELVHEAELVGITASTEHSDRMSIEIIVDGSPEEYLSHTIWEPTRVVQGPKEAEQKWLEIEAKGGQVFVIRWQDQPEG